MLTEHEKAVHDSKAKQKRVEGFGKDQYFKDDDASLQQMLVRDKIRGPMDMDANLAQSIMGSQKFKVFNEDDEYGQERGGGFEPMLRASESKDSKQSVMQVAVWQRVYCVLSEVYCVLLEVHCDAGAAARARAPDVGDAEAERNREQLPLLQAVFKVPRPSCCCNRYNMLPGPARARHRRRPLLHRARGSHGVGVGV